MQHESFREVSFLAADGGRIVANQYGDGAHAVVLAHGMVFDKESFAELAEVLAQRGFTALAIDFRGYGESTAGSEERALHLDVLAAVRYLHDEGAKRVSILGASMGGGAAARASTQAEPGDIECLILLSSMPIDEPEKMTGRKVFIASADERLMPRIREQFDRAAEPKRLIVLDGDAHAQHIFRTNQAERLTELIVEAFSSGGS